jgi:hypothetical protein
VQASDDAPHMVVSIPFTIANPLFQKQILPLPAVSVGLGAGLPSVRLAVGSVALEAAPAGRVGLSLRILVGDGKTTFAHLTTRLAVRPTVDAARGVVRVTLRGEDLRGIDATLAPKAADALVDALWKRLPKAARLLPKRQVSELLEDATRTVASRGFAELRDKALVRAGTLASLSFALPDLPIRDVVVRSTKDRLELEVRTTLPVERGLDAGAPGGSGLSVRLSGGAVAELANLGVAKGALGKRAGGDHGDCDYGFGWSGGDRPLTVLAWCRDEPCKRVEIAAVPRVAVRGERMAVQVDGEVVDVQGPPLMELASWLGLVRRPVAFAIETASRFEVVSGERPLTLRVTRVVGDADGMTVELEAQ